MHRTHTRTIVATAIPLLLSCVAVAKAEIPLAEHPRPDFQRTQWLNLNGVWEFQFDKENKGLDQNWATGKTEFPLSITVPFPWGSKLSGAVIAIGTTFVLSNLRVIPIESRERRGHRVVSPDDSRARRVEGATGVRRRRGL